MTASRTQISTEFFLRYQNIVEKELNEFVKMIMEYRNDHPEEYQQLNQLFKQHQITPKSTFEEDVRFNKGMMRSLLHRFFENSKRRAVPQMTEDGFSHLSIEVIDKLVDEISLYSQISGDKEHFLDLRDHLAQLEIELLPSCTDVDKEKVAIEKLRQQINEFRQEETADPQFYLQLLVHLNEVEEKLPSQHVNQPHE